MKIDAETMKKQVILHLPYVLFLLVFAKLGEAVRLAPGADASQKLLGLSEGFALAFQSMWPGAAMDWLIGLCGAAIMRLAVYLRGKDAKKYRKNVEYGSARWGNKADIAPFMDPKPENNIFHQSVFHRQPRNGIRPTDLGEYAVRQTGLYCGTV